MSKFAIVGGRDFSNQELFDSAMKEHAPTAIISGGATGADAMAAAYAHALDIELIEHRPDWAQYGRAAGPARNRKIIAEADCLIAFWDGKSKGTMSSISFAKKKGIPIYVYSY